MGARRGLRTALVEGWREIRSAASVSIADATLYAPCRPVHISFVIACEADASATNSIS
jgi:hypothetical protein